MKKQYLWIIIFIAFISCASTSSNVDTLNINDAIEQAAKEIAVLLSANTRVAIVGFESDSRKLSEYVMEELIGYLHENGVTDIAERRNLYYVRNELGFQLSGEVSDDSAVSIGKFWGAQVVIVGEIVNIGNVNRLRFNIVNVETGIREGSIRVTVRNDRGFRNFIATIDSSTRFETENYNTSSNSTPRTPGAFLDRGILFAVRGDFDIAIDDFTESLRLDPNYAAAYLQRGKALLATIKEVVFITENFNDFDLYVRTFSKYEDYEKSVEIAKLAVNDLSNAIRLYPTSNAYKYRGITYTGLEEYDNAFADFSQALRLAPFDISIYNYRSIAHLHSGDRIQAIADTTRAINIDPNHYLAWANRGNYRLFDETIDIDLAISDLNQAIKLSPNNPFIDFINLLLFLAHDWKTNGRW